MIIFKEKGRDALKMLVHVVMLYIWKSFLWVPQKKEIYFYISSLYPIVFMLRKTIKGWFVSHSFTSITFYTKKKEYFKFVIEVSQQVF